MTTKRLIVTVALVVIAVVVVGLVGAVVYINYYSAYAPYLAGNRAVAISRGLERTLENRAPFVAPADGTVSDEQTSRFARVEEQVEAVVAARATAIDSACRELEHARGEGSSVSALQAMKAIGSIESPFRDAKQAQVAALKAVGVSKDEYEWVRRQLYRAAEIELAQLDLDGMAAIKSTDDRVRIRRWAPEPSPSARRTVEPYIPRLERWRSLAFFGL
jgi:hypothetical protein